VLPGFGFESTGYPLSFFRDSLVIQDSAASMSWLDAVMEFRFKKNGWQSMQTSGSLFNWCTPDVISKWEMNEVKAPRFILFEVFLLWMGWFGKSGDLWACST